MKKEHEIGKQLLVLAAAKVKIKSGDS